MIRLTVKKVLVLALSFPFLFLPLGQAQIATGPLIFFSDLDSGPRTGGEGGAGVYVTIYGTRFGATQGFSTVSVGGVPAMVYKLWTDKKIAFQVPASAGSGAQQITVNVNGMTSGIPFTIRATGNIYCVSTNGSDANAGTFAGGCWRTVQHAVDAIGPGDTVYIRGGIVETNQRDAGSVVIGLNNQSNISGTPGNPIALIGYPGETARIGQAATAPCATGYERCIEGLSTYNIDSLYSYWTIANLTLRGNNFALHTTGNSKVYAPRSTNWRVIGNDMSCPWGNWYAGCVVLAQTDYEYIYGNNIHDTGSVNSDDHSLYPTTDSNHLWIGWNTIANHQGGRGIHIHSSPLGGANPDPTGRQQFDIHIHNNLIHDIQADGIILATVDPSQGPVEVYNNIIYNAGKGPWIGGNVGSGYYSCIYVPGYVNNGPAGGGVVNTYNNTLYNCGSFTIPGDGQFGAIGNGGNTAGLRMNITNNIVHQLPGLPYWNMYAPDGGALANDTGGLIFGNNNLFYGNGNPVSNPNITGSTYADPMLVNLPGLDFHLTAGSPAAYSGLPVPLETDYDGVSLSGVFPIGVYTLSGSGNAKPPSVSLSPASVPLTPGQTSQFVASVANAANTSVTWSLYPPVGILSSSGLYTAPAVISSPQNVSVTATLVADPTKSAVATVMLTSLPAVVLSLTPSSATLSGGQSQQFVVTAQSGSGSVAVPPVQWTLTPAVGSVSSTGLYSAPYLSSAQTVILKATSTLDSSQSATASIQIAPTAFISAVSATNIGSSAATIIWNTASAADGLVEYGTTTSYGWTSALTSVPSTSHTITLTNLAAATSYNFRVKSHDGSGQLWISDNFIFMTSAPSGGGSSGGFSWSVISNGGNTTPSLVVKWVAPPNPSAYDTIAVSGVNAPDWWSVQEVNTAGTAQGTFTTGPLLPGRYELRYLKADSGGSTSVVLRSAPIDVAIEVALTLSASSARTGGTLTLQWTAGSHRTTNDAIGLFKVGAVTETSIHTVYTDGAPTGSARVRMPGTAGNYELRYLVGDAYGASPLEAAVSNPITVF